jgi:hypothetical protein
MLVHASPVVQSGSAQHSIVPQTLPHLCTSQTITVDQRSVHRELHAFLFPNRLGVSVALRFGFPQVRLSQRHRVHSLSQSKSLSLCASPWKTNAIHGCRVFRTHNRPHEPVVGALGSPSLTHTPPYFCMCVPVFLVNLPSL